MESKGIMVLFFNLVSNLFLGKELVDKEMLEDA
jgi:hypothetical protein